MDRTGTFAVALCDRLRIRGAAQVRIRVSFSDFQPPSRQQGRVTVNVSRRK
jgi:hypothetical protein